MGTMDKNLLCRTCNGDFIQCPGHFGHIILEYPVYHVGYTDLCNKILSSVCHQCKKIMVKDEDLEPIKAIKNPKLRLHKIYNEAKSKSTCGQWSKEEEKYVSGCGYKNP